MTSSIREAIVRAKVGRLPNPETIAARRMLATMNGGTFTKRDVAIHLLANIGDNDAIAQALLHKGAIAAVEAALKTDRVNARLSDGSIIKVPRYMSFGNRWRNINHMTTEQYRQHIEEDRQRVQYDRDALAAKQKVLATLDRRGARRVAEVLLHEDDEEEEEVV